MKKKMTKKKRTKQKMKKKKKKKMMKKMMMMKMAKMLKMTSKLAQLRCSTSCDLTMYIQGKLYSVDKYFQ